MRFFEGIRNVILFYLILSLAACVALAGEADISWTAPTQNCDGSTLTNLSGYEVRWGTGTVTLPAGATSYRVTNLPPGNWWFSVAANAGDQQSQFVTATKVITDMVTIGTNVYTFVKNNDRIVTLPVGTIPTGVACDATQSVNGKYVVPRSEVTWSGSVRPVVVLADCG